MPNFALKMVVAIPDFYLPTKKARGSKKKCYYKDADF